MKKGFFYTSLTFVSLLLIACAPINLFTPLIDPSKMGNDAKMDAGYNAIEEGNYDEAIDYFSDIIDSGTGGDVLVDAYLGRASAYMNEASPNLDEVMGDIVSGNVNFDSSSDIITQIVENGEFDNFFDNAQDAADDYNSAIENSTGDIDPGILLEAYQTNMIAATGVGAQKIADTYNDGNISYGTLWSVNLTDPIETIDISGVPTPITFNTELDAIIASDRLNTDTYYHPYNLSTWGDTDPALNGLKKYVDGSLEEADMMGYLTNAFNSLEQLKANPPMGMSVSDLADMQNGILQWAYYGLDDSSLGIPTP